MSDISSSTEGSKSLHVVLRHRYPFWARYRDFQQDIGNHWQRIDDWCYDFKTKRPLTYFGLMLIMVVLVAVTFVGLAVMANPLDKPGFNV